MSAHWTVNIDPYAIHFPDGWIIPGIKWYGICYVVCFFLMEYFLKKYTRDNISDLSPEDNNSLLWIFAICSIIGGRVGYEILYQFDYLCANPWDIFFIWRGGMSIHGGIFGAICAIIYFSWTTQRCALEVADYIAASIPICLFFGRCSNFINAELVGTTTDVPWGVIFLYGYDQLVRHPSQLYEAASEGIILFIITQHILRQKINKPQAYFYGKASAYFLIFYSIFRCICEQFRQPDAELIWNLSRGYCYSLITLSLGVAVYIFAKHKHNS